MIIDTLISLYRRDLQKLKKELNSYNAESNLWIIDKEISNSGGNLCVHLIGNLNHFIGNVLGDTGYVRNREFEFSAKNIPREELIDALERVEHVVVATLSKLTSEDLKRTYPLIVFKEEMTTGYFLMHLLTHLNYHLGQINYHRRILDA